MEDRGPVKCLAFVAKTVIAFSRGVGQEQGVAGPPIVDPEAHGSLPPHPLPASGLQPGDGA